MLWPTQLYTNDRLHPRDSVLRAPPGAAGMTLTTRAKNSASGKDTVEPLTDQSKHGRKQDAGKEAGQRERPTEQWRLVRQHSDRAHERLRGEQADERTRRGSAPEEIRRHRKHEVRTTGHHESRRPAHEDAAP